MVYSSVSVVPASVSAVSASVRVVSALVSVSSSRVSVVPSPVSVAPASVSVVSALVSADYAPVSAAHRLGQRRLFERQRLPSARQVGHFARAPDPLPDPRLVRCPVVWRAAGSVLVRAVPELSDAPTRNETPAPAFARKTAVHSFS